jgi:glycosyltransferase involved in cell wall biosynthesis
LTDLRTLQERVKHWRTDGVLNKTSLIHAEIGYLQHDEFYTLFLSRRLAPEIPFCVTVHDPPQVLAPILKAFSLGFESTTLRRILRLYDHTPFGRATVRSLLRKAKCLFALSQGGAEALRTLLSGEGNIQVIPHVMFESPTSGSNHVQNGVTKILFGGFWGPTKGLEVLLEAFELVGRRLPEGNIRLLLSGDEHSQSGEYVQKVLKKARGLSNSDAIQLIGYSPTEQMSSMFSSADILVLPNTRGSRSCSGTAIRGMSAGLPIVASRISPFTELLHDGETGLLVAPNNPQALADSLRQLIVNRELRIQLGRNAQREVFSNNSPAKVAHTVAQVYDEIARS